MYVHALNLCMHTHMMSISLYKIAHILFQLKYFVLILISVIAINKL
jgi:hypothetical protein